MKKRNIILEGRIKSLLRVTDVRSMAVYQQGMLFMAVEKLYKATEDEDFDIDMDFNLIGEISVGIDVMNRFFELVKDVGSMEKRPLTEGRSIWMMLAPLKA